LFAAARRFAAEAYPGKVFPDLGVDAPCPLCQQPLGIAHERFVAFDQFISEEAEKTAYNRREAAKAAYIRLSNASLDVGMDAALRDELDALDPVLCRQVASLESELAVRRDTIKLACGGKLDWAELANMPIDPVQQLRVLAQQDIEHETALEKLVDVRRSAEVRALLAEYDDRVQLAHVKGAVMDALATMKLADQLRACSLDLRTIDITRKASELNQQSITHALARELRREFDALGVTDLEVSFRTAGQRGKTVFKLILEKPGEQVPGAVLII
jgi:hypothetical protein